MFVDLTGSLPISTKPMTSSDLVPGVAFYSQNNKIMFQNKMIPKIETPKVTASKSRNLGSNPYRQTYFRSRPNQTTSKVTESRLVKPADFKLKLVGDAKSNEIQTKKLENYKNIHPPKTLCGKSSESESESSEEESSEESSTGNPLSQCNSSEEGSGSESSEEKSGENNTSEEGTENTEAYGDVKTGENTTSEEGAEASGGQKVSEKTTLEEDKTKYGDEKEADNSEENGSSEGKSNEDEKKNSDYKTEEKTTSSGIKPVDTSEESENEYSSGKNGSGENSESSGKSEEKTNEDQTTPVIYPLTEVYYTTTDSNLPDEYTTNESNPSDEIVATTQVDSSNENNDVTTENSLNEISYATTQVNYLDQNNVVTTENSVKDPPTTEYKPEPITELPVFGKKLTDKLPITTDNSLNVDKLPTPKEDKKKIYNDDDPTIFYLGTKKLIPYYLRRSTNRKYPEGNKIIQKSSSITIGGTQRVARAKNPIESTGKIPKITTGGTQRDYALTGRFPPRTARG